MTKQPHKFKYYKKHKHKADHISDVANFNEIEQIVINETFNELDFGSILEYISKKCLTSNGKELILSAVPANRIRFDDIVNDVSLLKKEQLSWLNNELDLVEELLQLNLSDNALPLENIEDVRELLFKSKVDGAILSINEILNLLSLLRVSKEIKNYFINRGSDRYSKLSLLVTDIYDNSVLEKRITAAIDISGNIKDDASKELQRIRNEIISMTKHLRVRMDKIVRQFSDNNIIQEDFYTIREGRFVLPVKVEHKRHITGIIHGISQTGSTVYLEPSEVIEMNNEISLLKSEEQREIYNILKDLTKLIARDVENILWTNDIIGHIDAINAKSEYALKFGGIKPTIWNEREILLTKVYHPILVQNKGKQNVIPLSISFANNKRGHLISGPNAGGKTVALKNIGLNIILALSGFFPIGEVRTSMLNVFSAIGDNQSIENDLSTFSSQLLIIKRILDVADSDSVVLIDEICSGTDPREGSALASGIMDTFIELNLFFVVTTHQSSLKTYALNTHNNNINSSTDFTKTKSTNTTSSVVKQEINTKYYKESTIIENDSFEFDESELKPTYNFLSGIPGNSYAFFLARNVGLANNVISRAKKYLGGRTKQIEKSITILQKYKKETEAIMNEARTEKNKYEGMKKDYENRKQEFATKKKKMINDAKLEANDIIQKANSLIENSLKQIKENHTKANEIKQEFHKQQKQFDYEATIIKQTQNNTNNNLQIPTQLNTNNIVGMLNGTESGIVIEANNNEKTAIVAFNGLKFRLPYSQLYIKEKEKIKTKKNSTIIQKISLSINTRLDLRGDRTEEAISKTNKFIADAVMNNADFVTIIHGKGTGILRHFIHELLKNIPEVKHFRLGDQFEGGDGATIVYLK